MIAGLILAAGESTRMGADKALLLYRGRTFLETVLTTLHDAGIDSIVVVLGHRAEEIRRAVELPGAEVVINPDYRQGQTSSLKAGLKALESPALEAIVMSLVDHPAVSAETVRKLVEAFLVTRLPVVIPTYQNQRGHPVVIGRALFEELERLTAEEGANAVIHQYREATKFVEVNDRGIVLDVDDPETYSSLGE